MTFHRSLNELVSEQKFKTEVSWPLSRASLLWFDSSKVAGHLSSSSSDQSAASYLNVFLHLWTGTKKYLLISYFQTFSEENKGKERRELHVHFTSSASGIKIALSWGWDTLNPTLSLEFSRTLDIKSWTSQLTLQDIEGQIKMVNVKRLV